jgi:hypothetical protein
VRGVLPACLPAWLTDPGRSNSAAMQHLFARVIEGTWQVRRAAT